MHLGKGTKEELNTNAIVTLTGLFSIAPLIAKANQEQIISILHHPTIGLSAAITWLTWVVYLRRKYFQRLISLVLHPNTQQTSKSSLIQTWIYAYSRNPIYIGYIWITGWLVLWNPTTYNLIIVIIYIALLRTLVAKEEKNLISLLWDTYIQYMEKVDRWLPLPRIRKQKR
jgi:protein-S-isoprenylcysteine O-methyltransferase Ste14